MACELCEAARITEWFHEDETCWVADCEICQVPMVVWKRHGPEPSDKERSHMLDRLHAVAEARFGEGGYSELAYANVVARHFGTMDALMGAGATRATLWLNLGWAVVLVPTLWFASEAGGIRGAAYAQTGVAILVAVPLAAYALHRARVALAPVGLALVRPLGAAVLAAAVAVVVVRFAGTNAFVQLAVAGTAGVLVYVPIAVPREQLRQLWTALRHRQPAGAALAE